MWRRVILPAIVTITAAATTAFAFHIMPRTRDGSSVRRAVRFEAPNAEVRAEREWAWIDEHYPNTYALRWMHSTIVQNGWVYSRYDLETTTGHKEVYFDRREREPRE